MDYSLQNREGSHDECRSQARRRRSRTVFTAAAIRRMENVFDLNRYPDIHERESLAAELDIPEPRIQVWFQNRRSRNKKTVKPDTNPSDVTQDGTAKQTTRTLLARSLRKKTDRNKNLGEDLSIQTPSERFQVFNSSGESPFGYVNNVASHEIYRDWLLLQYHMTSWNPWYPFYQTSFQQQSVEDRETAEQDGYQSASSSGPVSESGSISEEECIVDRLFRFSKPRQRVNSEEVGPAVTVKMTVPHINRSGYQATYFQQSEDRCSDDVTNRSNSSEDNSLCGTP